MIGRGLGSRTYQAERRGRLPLRGGDGCSRGGEGRKRSDLVGDELDLDGDDG
jgi:hypothetical protein